MGGWAIHKMIHFQNFIYPGGAKSGRVPQRSLITHKKEIELTASDNRFAA
jgi:hypothetical protein